MFSLFVFAVGLVLGFVAGKGHTWWKVIKGYKG
jgi:hypothetical protein